MGSYVVTLDSHFYTRKNAGTLALRGWMYTGTEEPVIQARAEHKDLFCTLKRIERPDVIAVRKDLEFPNDWAGFEIEIPELENSMQQEETLRVRVVCGSEKIPLFQKSLKELNEEYEKEYAIMYKIDEIALRNENIYVRGWAVFFGETLNLEIRTEDGERLEGVSWQRMFREDVRSAYQVKQEQCTGFAATFPRSLITGRSFDFFLESDGVERREHFPVKKVDRENQRLYRMRKLLSADYRARNLELIEKRGLRTFFDYLWQESGITENTYQDYFLRNRATPSELKKQRKEIFRDAPLFSIVIPLYKTPDRYLKEMIDSILAQSYGEWELCLADGSGDDTLGKLIRQEYRGESRIRYKLLRENTGIAGNTNRALEMARGDYIVFADHDDIMEPDALYQAARILQKYPETEFLYTDEDFIDAEGEILEPWLKSDFNLELLRCIDYIGHLVVVKTELYRKVGGIQSAFDGAQDYDFILRCVEKTDRIRHIPLVLYHRRRHPGSLSEDPAHREEFTNAGIRALSAHYERVGLKAEVEDTGIYGIFRSRFAIEGDPKVSILIPNKDHIEDLDQCIRSIEEKSTWKNLEIIVIENNSEQKETFAYYEKIREEYPNIILAHYSGIFNYSAINNFGVQYASGDYYLLLNNDTEVITPDWIERMLGYCQRENVAMVGAKLFYPDNTVQHGGVVVGLGGVAAHVHCGLAETETGYIGRLVCAQEISAVTAACLLVKKEVYEELNGLDEAFKVAFNDIDFCLRARARGKKIIFTPDARLYHYESKSRGYEDTPEKQERFSREIALFQERFRDVLDAGDPYYNPHLTLDKTDCSMRKPYEFLKGR